MKHFFRVDQSMKLYEGQKINFVKKENNKPEELQTRINFLFPEGVTDLGYNLLDSNANNVSNLVELVFEYVRRSYYSEKPSRFQSIFAFDNIEQAKLFRYKFCDCKNKIWEVESITSFRADMSLLDLPPNCSLLQLDYMAHLYWNSETEDSRCTFWEYLLVPPVKVIRKVDG
jgi:hypothetical protein